jgi:hypothetical protein
MAGTPADFTRIRHLLEQVVTELKDFEATAYQPQPGDEKAERWNLWLPRGLRRRIEALAKARGHAPSKVVQELLWRALSCEAEVP